jgi:hypothetical protein
MPALPPLINGRSYGWADISALINGLPFAGITEIDYSDTQDIQNVYGAGNRPVSRGFGKITYAGSVTMSMEDLEILQKASLTGRIQDIPEFPIVVAFVPDTGTLVTHTLKYCRFTNNGRTMKEGDVSFATKIDLVIGDIAWK